MKISSLQLTFHIVGKKHWCYLSELLDKHDSHLCHISNTCSTQTWYVDNMFTTGREEIYTGCIKITHTSCHWLAFSGNHATNQPPSFTDFTSIPYITFLTGGGGGGERWGWTISVPISTKGSGMPTTRPETSTPPPPPLGSRGSFWHPIAFFFFAGVSLNIYLFYTLRLIDIGFKSW